ncbi:ETX/MTX2 family pore-forming toxin [Lonsdalea quercina]|uniref:ETX/MTX2 family pore-forming toxin n=1 Tax=Lonsdalea quercina TaxID=71657 RepID=UPI00397574AF
MFKNVFGIRLTVMSDNASANGVDKNVINVAISGTDQTDSAQVILEITSGSAVFFDSGEKKITVDTIAGAIIKPVSLISDVAEITEITATISNTSFVSTINVNFKALNILSLQELTDIWGNWYASKGNTTCNFTSSTDYSPHPELDDYSGNQCKVNYKDIEYSNFSENPGEGILAADQKLTNNTSVQQSETFTWSKSLTNTFTWAITEAIKVTSKLSFSIGIPVIAEGKIEESVEISVSATETTTTTGTTTWGLAQPVIVPPNSSVECISIVNQNTASLDFSATGEIVGYVAVWTKEQINGHWLTFHRIDTVFEDIVNNNLASIYGYDIDSGVGVIVTAKGKTTGLYGVSIDTEYN